jgi:hypothetical protein
MENVLRLSAAGVQELKAVWTTKQYNGTSAAILVRQQVTPADTFLLTRIRSKVVNIK